MRVTQRICAFCPHRLSYSRLNEPYLFKKSAIINTGLCFMGLIGHFLRSNLVLFMGISYQLRYALLIHMDFITMKVNVTHLFFLFLSGVLTVIASAEDCQLVVSNVTDGVVEMRLTYEDINQAATTTDVAAGKMQRVMPIDQHQYLQSIHKDGQSCKAIDFRLPIRVATKNSKSLHCLVQVQVRVREGDGCYLIKK